MNYPWASRLMVMLSVAVAGSALATPRKPSVAVQSVPIAAHTLVDTLTAYGRISVDPQATTALVAQAPAYVDTLQTSPGAEVHKGQPLLSLRTTPAAQAQYRVAQSQLRFAEQALKRQRQLLTQQLATHADIEAAQNTLAGAQAAFDTQKALGNGQALRTISAPFAGIVSALSVSLGQQLGAGTTLLELARGDSLQAVLAIPASQRQQVHVGSAVLLGPVFDLAGPDAQPVAIHAAIDAVDGVVDSRSAQLNARISLAGAQTRFVLPGMAISARITLATQTTLAVPRAAVLHDQQGDYLFVVDRQQAHRVSVHTGIHDQGMVGVSGGLHVGDRVVTLGNYELTDGSAIRAGS